jgi:hypothetical protein
MDAEFPEPVLNSTAAYLIVEWSLDRRRRSSQ